jgi:SAM-dependent methyltransferase
MDINYIHNETIHNPHAAEQILPFVFHKVKADAVIDFGCGTGTWLKIAKQLGAKKVLGIDGIHIDRKMLCIEDHEFLRHDLTFPLMISQKYDLAICLEVVEHLPEQAADHIVELITQSSDVVLFSAAIPGQGGQSHINEQWPDYWNQKFRKNDFFPVDNLRQTFWDNEKIEWWYRQNILLYVKKNAITGLPAPTNFPVYIHPELFDLKLQLLRQMEQELRQKNELIRTAILEPRFFPTLKRLVKSLLK